MENDFTKTVSFFRFEDLRVYHKALDYTDWVAEATQLAMNNQPDGAGAKLNSAAQSIALYIAEGSAKNKTQFVHYLKLAKSAIRECIVLTSIMEKQGKLTDSSVETSRTHLIELTKMIGALIGSLQKNNNKNHSSNHNNEFNEELETVDPFNARRY